MTPMDLKILWWEFDELITICYTINAKSKILNYLTSSVYKNNLGGRGLHSMFQLIACCEIIKGVRFV